MSAEAGAEARAAELREEIARYDHAYYVLDDQLIGDDEYDTLLDELRAIEAENPDLRTPDSPTQRVGGKPLDKFEQVEHAEQMLSLANARTEEDMLAWDKRVRNLLARYDISAEQFGFVTEPKVDGLAISLTFSSEPIGTMCSTFWKRPLAGAPTRCVGESGVISSGRSSSSAFSSS